MEWLRQIENKTIYINSRHVSPCKETREFKEKLLIAVTNKDETLFKEIIKESTPDLNKFLYGMCSGILHLLARRGTRAMIKHFISCGGEICIPDENDNTPLHYALQYKNTKNVLCLLEHGASVLLENKNGMSALHLAALYYKNSESIHAILKKGCDVNRKHPVLENTALHLVCHKPLSIKSLNYEAVKCLIECGADVNAKNLQGMTPFLLACRYRNIDVISHFIFKYGADIHSTCKKGRSALHYAVQAGNDRVIKLLLSQGCDVNGKDCSGKTPLFFTAFNSPTNIRLLAHYGADITAVDNDGNTALHSFATTQGFFLKGAAKSFLELQFNIIDVVNKNDETPLECALKQETKYSGRSCKPSILNSSNLIAQIKIHMKLGKRISEKNVKLIQEDARAYAFYKNCESELNALEKHKISDNSNVCLLEFLTQNVYTLSAYCRNKDFNIIILNSRDLFKNFPIYRQRLLNNFIDGSKRRNNLDIAKGIFEKILKDSFILPDVVSSQIFRYFSDLELQVFIDEYRIDTNDYICVDPNNLINMNTLDLEKCLYYHRLVSWNPIYNQKSD